MINYSLSPQSKEGYINDGYLSLFSADFRREKHEKEYPIMLIFIWKK